jgi:hypothetical protein
MNKTLTVLLVLFLIVVNSNAQLLDNSITFIPTFNNEQLLLGRKYFLPSKQDSVEVTKLKFYISSISFYKKAKRVKTLSQKPFLFDFENEGSKRIDFPNVSVDSISFLIGIDSITNEMGVQPGSLDPVNNMYWAWQSGYIHFKLEGKYASAKPFQYHIGGYKFQYNTIQNFGAKVFSKITAIEIDIAKLLSSIKDIAIVMSPSEDAVKISNYIKNCFVQQ